jgi:hypothetical protein
VKNEKLLCGIKKGRNIPRTMKRRNANWIGHIVRRNCLLKHVIEGKMEWRRRRGTRCGQLLVDLKEKRRF